VVLVASVARAEPVESDSTAWARVVLRLVQAVPADREVRVVLQQPVSPAPVALAGAALRVATVAWVASQAMAVRVPLQARVAPAA
jgi:hypothetical protein